MRVLIQRVKNAFVVIDNIMKAQIDKGLLVFVGIENDDNQEDITWLAHKIANLRLFDDMSGVMNLSVVDTDSEILVVSQFTLHASTKKGNRPSYIKAAKPEIAIPLYEKFCDTLDELIQKPIQTGVFGANMSVELVNDGPVTIWIDSRNKE